MEVFGNNPRSYLALTILATDTTLTVLDSSVYPVGGRFRIIIDEEFMMVTNVAGNVLTVTRAIENTVADTHYAGRAVTHILTAGGLLQAISDYGGSGNSGWSGYSGRSGSSGFSGVSGTSGVSGFSGKSGYSGGTGGSGFSGYSGKNGIDGISGYSGLTGTSGVSGASGKSGFSGYSGYSGATGPTGDTGASGFSGVSGTNATGVSGFSGYSGKSGTSGFSGYSGYSGKSGATGPDGASGFSGVNGSDGTSGVSGFSGRSGSSGFSGYSGYSGVSGISGFSGKSGYSGKSGWAGTFQYIFDSTQSSPAAQGTIRTDTDFFDVGVTTLWASKGDIHNFAAGGVFNTINVNDYILLSDQQGGIFDGSWLLKVNSITNDAGHTQYVFGVSNVTGSGSVTPNGDLMGFYIVRASGSGVSGYSGTSGYSGNGQSGYSGKSGFSGWSGYSGAAGTIGVDGASGFSGYSGVSGASGKSGFSGYSGYSGATGSAGSTGTSGFSGYSGKSGTSGFSGYSGALGGSTPLTINSSLIEPSIALTDASTIATNAATGSFFKVTLGGNRTLGNPTGATDGQVLRWQITQDGTGGRTLALDTKFDTTLIGGGSISIASAASAISILGAYYDSGADKFRIYAILPLSIGTSGYSGVGTSGFSGYSGGGTSGFSGYSGASGYSGYSGKSGFSGYSGYSGNGTSGFSGYSGTTPTSLSITKIIEPYVALTDASTVATDASTGSFFKVTLGASRTLGNPSSATAGQIIRWEISQDGTGGRVITLDTKFNVGLFNVTLSTAASKRDYLTVIYNSGADKFDVVGFTTGY